MRRTGLWLAILGVGLPAWGVTAELSDNDEAAADERPKIEASVLVTASLMDAPAERLPVSAEVIGRAEIEARQTTDVADLLRTVPGLDVVRSGSSGKATSLFTRGTESDHTLVLWNGVELNNPRFGGFDWGVLSADGVERVEVLRGPFSALHGSDAVGGVVHVLTGVDRDRLSVEGGGDGYFRSSLTAGFESDRLRLHAAGHSRRSDGAIANDRHDSEDAFAGARWQLGEGVSVGLTARHNDSEVGIPFAGGMASPERSTDWRESELSIPFEVRRARWSFDSRLSRTEFDSRFEDPNDPFGFTAADSGSLSERARAVAGWRRNDRWQLSIGSEYETQEVDSGSVFGPDLVAQRQTTRALFGQLLYTAGRWRFDLGLRADDHDAFGSETTPRLGVGLVVNDRHRLHVAAAEGFRAPSIGELHFPLSGNPELAPERSESAELGWVWTGVRTRTTITLFTTELDDLIDFDFIDFRNVNRGRARSEGVETGWRWSGRATAVRASAAWLDARNLDSGGRLLRRPEWRGSVVGSWRPTDWTLNATVLHVGDRPDVDPLSFARRVNDAYQRVDLAARYRGWSRWSPYARVENLTDERYEEALGFAAPGITWIGGVSVDFKPRR